MNIRRSVTLVLATGSKLVLGACERIDEDDSNIFND
jgi:hypothetical protein